MLSNIKIVLVETSHPGNIGAVARAMKNMMMTNLVLVKPKIFPCAEATARASGADDVLAKAVVYDSLPEAIADCHWVYGTSARSRTISWPEISPRLCAEQVMQQSKNAKIGIIFGRENSGLNNEELDKCQYLLKIPCNPEYSSLNIAAAVQIICYELFVASNLEQKLIVGDYGESIPANAAQMEQFYSHLQEVLLEVGFMVPERSKTIMRRLRRIYNRSQLDSKEVDILRGILTMSQGHKRKLL